VSILVDPNTKVITQGLTGDSATFHARQPRDCGPPMVARVDLAGKLG
jgi:succinyl-CoA synthetase alpha subunit